MMRGATTRRSCRAAMIAAALLAAAACQQGGDADKAAGGDVAASRDAGTGEGKSILDALSRSADHATLVNALKAAGLTETLSGSGPYTLFAPTEAAFGKLPAGAAADLLAPESKARLTALLTSHVVPGVVTAKDLAAAIERGTGKAELATLGGTTLTVTRPDDAIVVAQGGAQGRVSQADLMQANGVVHSVDAVLTGR